MHFPSLVYKFINGSMDVSCLAVLTSNGDRSTLILEIDQSTYLPTSSFCISVLSGGNYQLQVYDIDSDGKVVPEIAFLFENVVDLGFR